MNHFRDRHAHTYSSAISIGLYESCFRREENAKEAVPQRVGLLPANPHAVEPDRIGFVRADFLFLRLRFDRQVESIKTAIESPRTA